MSDVGDVVEHRQLLYKIEKAFPSDDYNMHFNLYQQVLKCVAKREFVSITVFCWYFQKSLAMSALLVFSFSRAQASKCSRF